MVIIAASASHGANNLYRNHNYLSRRNHKPAVHTININTNTVAATSSSSPCSTFISLRGGEIISTQQNTDVTDDDDDTESLRRKQQQSEEHEKLIKYRMEQQMLYQLRSTYLTEMLAMRGVPNLPTIVSVSTADGEKPPEKVDWDCALCTDEEPKSCLYSFDAEPNTKVVAPLGTDQWISLTALNRLRRTDPTKVEPMWHSRYSILQSWFSDESEFSLLQHVGLQGFFISSVLLDGANGMVLRSLLIVSVLSVFLLLMPFLEYVVGRILVSAPFWAQWMTWGRIARAGFPLKLLIGQLVWKGVASSFSKMENAVREYIVDLECDILEECVPVTVGVGADDDADESAMELEDNEEDVGDIMDIDETEDDYNEDEYDAEY